MDYRNNRPLEGNVYCIVHNQPREPSRPIPDEPVLGRISLKQVTAADLARQRELAELDSVLDKIQAYIDK